MCINTESAFPKINIPVRERASTPVCPSVSLTYCTISPLSSLSFVARPMIYCNILTWNIYIYIGKMNWQPTLYGRKFATLPEPDRTPAPPCCTSPPPSTTWPSTSVHQNYFFPNLSVNHRKGRELSIERRNRSNFSTDKSLWKSSLKIKKNLEKIL